MISLGGLVNQKAFGKFEMGKVVSNPFATAFIKEAEGEDHEVSMGQNQLDTIIKMATELKAKMGENEKEIPAWIQDHISKAENYISQAAGNYHEYGTNESVNEDGASDQIADLQKKKQQVIDKTSALLIKQKQLINKGYAGSYPWENYDKWPSKLKMEVAKIDQELEKLFAQTQAFFVKIEKLKGTYKTESVNEATFNFGKEEYTKKNLTPTQIQDLAFGYVQTPITKLVGKTLGHRVNLANDLARLTGTKQLDAKVRGKQPALIMVLLKNKLVSKEEYIQMYKDLIEKHQQVIKYLKNASPEMRNSGGAARAAAKDMKGEFDME
jgi:hypothetical protein